ncbi:MAG: hypothetical protein NC184_03990 [Roseburia sp.]|nr:hypothetical protein [Roseburia sp.]
MEKDNKLEQVKAACAEFVREHINDTREFSTCEIREAIESKLDFKLNYKVSDFAQDECNKPYSKNNGEYFVRTRHGYYIVKK